MSKFQIQRLADREIVFSGRVTDAAAFRDELINIKGAGAVAEGAFYLDGKSVSFQDALQAAYDAVYAARDKKLLTHKRITFHDGVCGSLASNTRRSKWVRK